MLCLKNVYACAFNLHLVEQFLRAFWESLFWVIILSLVQIKFPFFLIVDWAFIDSYNKKKIRNWYG